MIKAQNALNFLIHTALISFLFFLSFIIFTIFKYFWAIRLTQLEGGHVALYVQVLKHWL